MTQEHKQANNPLPRNNNNSNSVYTPLLVLDSGRLVCKGKWDTAPPNSVCLAYTHITSSYKTSSENWAKGAGSSSYPWSTFSSGFLKIQYLRLVGTFGSLWFRQLSNIWTAKCAHESLSTAACEVSNKAKLESLQHPDSENTVRYEIRLHESCQTH